MIAKTSMRHFELYSLHLLAYHYNDDQYDKSKFAKIDSWGSNEVKPETLIGTLKRFILPR